MINRDGFTRPILELFRLFIPSGKDKRDERTISRDEALRYSHIPFEDEETTSDGVGTVVQSIYGVAPTNAYGLESSLMLDLAGQVSAGMWRVLTTNLEVLPTLTLTQWQIVFDVIGESRDSSDSSDSSDLLLFSFFLSFFASLFASLLA